MNTNSCSNVSFFAKNQNQPVPCSKGGNLPPTAPVNYSELGPRRSRGKVKEQITDYVLLMLGAPVIDIELDQQQIDLAVDLSMQIVEEYAPREYFNYYTFNTIPGKSVYEMPAEIGYIRNVSYMQHPTFAFTASDIGGAIPVEYFYPGGAYASVTGGLIDPTTPIWGRAGEWMLYKQYEQMYTNLASQTGGWEWVSDYRHIKLYPIPARPHGVVVHYIQRYKDFNQVTQALQEGALAFAKIMVGRIRSKIKNPPGPNGGVQLDGAEILAEGLQDKKDWEEKLLTKFGDILGPTWG